MNQYMCQYWHSNDINEWCSYLRTSVICDFVLIICYVFLFLPWWRNSNELAFESGRDRSNLDCFPRTFVPWNSLGNDRSAPRMCKLVEEFSSEFPSEEGTSGSSENNKINTRTPTDFTFLKTGSRRLASCLLFETAWEWNLFSFSPQPRDLFLRWSSSGNRRYSTCVKMSATKLKHRKCLEVSHS